MPLSHPQIRQYLTAFDFRRLFNGLGWDNYAAKESVLVNGQTYALAGVAVKRGMAVLICEQATIPPYATRRAIDRAVTKNVAYEHIIIFADSAHATQVWQWVKREAGRPDAAREQTFHAGTSADALVQKIARIAFTLDEEESLTMPQATGRVARALDVESVTKRFYAEFKKQHTAFRDAIAGIPADAAGQRDWYASLMLNRLMFIYFIQSKGLLDGDQDYLPNRLKATQARLGPDRFHGFYREFLLQLFHDGLSAPLPHAPEIVALIGDVPYLNGGLFDLHEIERIHTKIEIPDTVFAAVFAFFGQWNWHLDTRPNRAGNEINPDILGYIFEQYINQKEMGAYYTKEDITEYIGKNTIVPFLFDAAKRHNAIAFAPDGAVWGLLREHPDKYIYDAVRKGSAAPLPPEIAAGIADVSNRGGWNKAVNDDTIALPTETWREFVARRRRYEETWNALVDGEVATINDLITRNLDIRQFAQDVIDNCESPDLLNALWETLAGKEATATQPAKPPMTILDPTCGSGAFLFAALNILEPLYDACLERMQAFVDAPGALIGAGTRDRYTRILAAYAGRDRPYAIIKSIIVGNLYGVDIMAEAVEICKLRLFLKLAAHLDDIGRIEPLPDIDFNIRAGNTLVGFANADDARRAVGRLGSDTAFAAIAEQAEITGRIVEQFQRQQAEYENPITPTDKAALRAKMDDLRDALDPFLAATYGIDRIAYADADEYAGKFAAWRTSHQPFHWWSEFFPIIKRGGFDVIIGNPPYVEYSKVRKDYTVIDYETQEANNLFAFVTERCLKLKHQSGDAGLILQLSAFPRRECYL